MLTTAPPLFPQWLAYGCSVGARVKRSAGFATVVEVHSDDRCSVRIDNQADRIKTEIIELRPDTVSRTSSPAYKSGQKLLLLYERQLVEAVVDEWLGVRSGSAHRVRLGKGSLLGKGKPAVAERVLIEVDLNEDNHAKLMFSSGAKYDDTCRLYLDKLASRHATVKDEPTGKELQVCEQRLFLSRYVPPDTALTTAPSGAIAGAVAEPETKRARPRFASAELRELATAAINALKTFKSLLMGEVGAAEVTVLRAQSRPERELLHAQVLAHMAELLRSGEVELMIRPVPISLSMAALTAALAEEKRVGVRDMLTRAFEVDYPTHADMLGQAMELRALVVVAEVRELSELASFTPAVLEELLMHRLVITMGVSTADGVPIELPPALLERAKKANQLQVLGLGVYMNDMKVDDLQCRAIFRRMRLRGKEPSLMNEYGAVSTLHVAGGEVGPAGMQELYDLLTSEACELTRLDLCSALVDGQRLVAALKGNTSLTSLDVRFVSQFPNLHTPLADVLLSANAICRLGYLRCDAFELPEGQTSVSLREKTLDKAATRLLAGILRRNTTVRELDLSATDLEPEGAAEVVRCLSRPECKLTTLKMALNPALDEEAKVALQSSAVGTQCTLEF